jgi:hypothetical protein
MLANEATRRARSAGAVAALHHSARVRGAAKAVACHRAVSRAERLAAERQAELEAKLALEAEAMSARLSRMRRVRRPQHVMTESGPLGSC